MEFTSEESRSIPVSLSPKYLIKEEGRFFSPSFSFTCHCQSVMGQYPIPNQMPNKNQDAPVNRIVTRCALRVAGQIHPNILKPMITRCRMVKNTSTACSIDRKSVVHGNSVDKKYVS